MSSESLNNSINEDGFLNDVNNDPPLNAVRIGENNEQIGPGEEDGVIDEQISIQDLAQRIEGLARPMQDRDSVLFERINTLEKTAPADHNRLLQAPLMQGR